MNLADRADLAFEDFQIGQKLNSRGRTMTEADIRLFIGATGSDPPIHTDSEHSRNHPILRDVCMQGLLSLSVLDGFLVDTLTRRMPVVMNYGHDKVRYLAPVYCHDTIRAEFLVSECENRDRDYGKVAIDCVLKNQRGEAVLFDRHLLIVGTRDHVRRTIACRPPEG